VIAADLPGWVRPVPNDAGQAGQRAPWHTGGWRALSFPDIRAQASAISRSRCRVASTALSFAQEHVLAASGVPGDQREGVGELAEQPPGRAHPAVGRRPPGRPAGSRRPRCSPPADPLCFPCHLRAMDISAHNAESVFGWSCIWEKTAGRRTTCSACITWRTPSALRLTIAAGTRATVPVQRRSRTVTCAFSPER
jgi:hypothetical protein